MDDKQLALFDYGTLDIDTRSFVQTKTAEIRIFLKQTIEGTIEAGKRLKEIKEALPHGEFLPWLHTEFDWSERTAQYFMKVYDAYKSAHYADLNNFDKTATKLLAYASEEAREEALSLAESGERITHAKAQEIIAEHKAKANAAMEGFTTQVSGGFAW